MGADLDLAELNRRLAEFGATDILKWTYGRFPAEAVRTSTSFGAEGMALVHMLIRLVGTPSVFTIDTGRQFQETYDVWQETEDRYGIRIDAYAPSQEDLLELVREGGPNRFYRSVEDRRRCCEIRKVRPLRRALAGARVWLTAIRRGQTESRADTEAISFDEGHGVYKICPLFLWSEEDVWDYVRANNLPYNTLHDAGYPTIGCRPCTRPVAPGADPRSGRWWWEEGGNRECGLHLKDGKLVRAKPGWGI